MSEIWRDEFDGIRDLRGCCVFTMHPQVIGRPGRLVMLDEVIRHVLADDRVWVAALGELADHARSSER